MLDINKELGKKWTILILEELYHNKSSSFSYLSANIKSITNRVLSARLRYLEANGLIKKNGLNNGSLKFEYSLTQKGRELVELFNSIKQWGIKYKIVKSDCVETNCNNCKN